MLVALAACAGDGGRGAREAAQESPEQDELSAEAFAEAYAAAAEQYADALEAVQAAGMADVASDPVGAHEVYDALRETTEAARTDVAGLPPPADVADEHAAVVALLAEQVDALTEAVAASRTRDDRALQTHLADYSGLLADWREAHDALTRRLEGA